MSWFGPSEYVAIGAAVFLILAALIASIAFDRQERRRRREWHRDYFERGDLVRSLMKRWRGTPRLTDRSTSRDDRQS